MLGWPQEQCPKAAAPNSRPPPSDPPKPAIAELIEYHHLPDWAKDNCFIRTGYRRVKACDRHCLDSLWYLHNETLNVWT
jgi:adiponectin receptor